MNEEKLEYHIQVDSPITKKFKRKYVTAQKIAGDIQDRIKEYNRKLDEVKEKIAKDTQYYDYMDEDIYSLNDSSEDLENNIDEFDQLDQQVDLTPAKGSITKIKKKRKIFDMLSNYNEVQRRYVGCSSLKKFQVQAIEKMHSGEHAIVSDLPLEGKGLIWTLLKTDENFTGKIIVFLNESRLKKRLEVLEQFNVPYITHSDIDKDTSNFEKIFEYGDTETKMLKQSSQSNDNIPDKLNRNLFKEIENQVSKESMANSQFDIGKSGLGKSDIPKSKEVIIIPVEYMSQKVSEFLEKFKNDMKQVVQDNQKFDWLYLARKFSIAQLLVQGLYDKSEAEFIAKSYDISCKNIITCNNKISLRLETSNFSRDEDKSRSIINWCKENKENKVYPIAIVVEHIKTQGSQIQDAQKTIGVKVGFQESLCNKSNLEAVVTNQSKSEMINCGNYKYVYFMNLHKNLEQILNEQVTKGFCNHHYFISDKEYIKKRNCMILDFIEPSNFVKFCKYQKKISKASNSSEKKYDIELSEGKTASLKNSPQEDKLTNKNFYIKQNCSEALNFLGISKKEPLFQIFRLLEKRSVFELVRAVPLVFFIEVVGPLDQAGSEVQAILSKGKKVSLNSVGFKVSTRDFFEEDLDSDINDPDLYYNLWSQINSLTVKGLITFEVQDWCYTLKVKEHLGDVEIYSMLNERSHQELDIIYKFDTLFSALKSNSLGVFNQITKGIKSTVNVIDLKVYIKWLYTDCKSDNLSNIVGNYKEILPIKSSFPQRDKTSIQQEFCDLYKHENIKLKSYIKELKSLPENMRKKSIVVYTLKNQYGGASYNTFKYLKTNINMVSKYSGFDFVQISEILQESFKSLKLDLSCN